MSVPGFTSDFRTWLTASLTTASEAALTSREHEVARLVAQGLTNREIGNALVISPGTVHVHVKHILAKLGFRGRAQIASWVSAQAVAA
jgi:DNA-binding NarL/FixJ family response regulator